MDGDANWLHLHHRTSMEPQSTGLGKLLGPCVRRVASQPHRDTSTYTPAPSPSPARPRPSSSASDVENAFAPLPERSLGPSSPVQPAFPPSTMLEARPVPHTGGSCSVTDPAGRGLEVLTTGAPQWVSPAHRHSFPWGLDGPGSWDFSVKGDCRRQEHPGGTEPPRGRDRWPQGAGKASVLEANSPGDGSWGWTFSVRAWRTQRCPLQISQKVEHKEKNQREKIRELKTSPGGLTANYQSSRNREQRESRERIRR